MSEIPHYEIGQKLVCVRDHKDWGLVAGQIYEVVEQSPFQANIRVNHWANRAPGGNGFSKEYFKPAPDLRCGLLSAIALARKNHPDVFGGTAK